MPTVKLYGADWCSQCKTAERMLEQKGIEFEKVDVDDDTTSADVLLRQGVRALPVLTEENNPMLYAGLKGVQEFINGR